MIGRFPGFPGVGVGMGGEDVDEIGAALESIMNDMLRGGQGRFPVPLPGGAIVQPPRRPPSDRSTPV